MADQARLRHEILYARRCCGSQSPCRGSKLSVCEWSARDLPRLYCRKDAFGSVAVTSYKAGLSRSNVSTCNKAKLT